MMDPSSMMQLPPQDIPDEPSMLNQGEVQDSGINQVLEDLAMSLLKKRDAAVQGRAASGVERRWLEDEAAFDGIDTNLTRKSVTDYAMGAIPQPSAEPARSKIVANIARSKCETAWGRFAEMVAPVDDRNWGLSPTPVPELVNALKDDRPAALAETNQPLAHADGTPATISHVAQAEMVEAKDRMKLMETEIDDQLCECNYNGEFRKHLWDAVKLGTGIIKGPSVAKRIKKSWSKQESQDGTKSVYILAAIEEFKPELKRVDPWNVFPDPNCGDDIKKAAYIWERDTILSRDLAGLIGMDGYFDDQIKMAMDEDPVRTSVSYDKQQQLSISRTLAGRGNNYERWFYNGDVSKEDMDAMGCPTGQDNMALSVSACVEFVNDRPIKVTLNMLDTGDLPYDFFPWTPVSNSVWGIGIPRMQYYWDQVLTGAWRAMMDNAGDSAGSNIVLGAGIEPADGVWEITGKKAWRASDEIDDVSKSVFQWQTGNNQPALEQIIKLALEFIDMETSLPRLFQGEKMEAPETLGATNIMVDANNVALRSRVKRLDDDVTRPAITRMYHWNMQYNQREDIKGDYNVDARGVTVLLAKDTQTRALIQAFQLKQDPDVNATVDWKKATKLFFQNQHLDIVKTDDEMKLAEETQTKQQPQVDPRIAGQVQVAQVRTQGELEKAKLTQQTDMQEIQIKAQNDQTDMQFRAVEAEKDRQLQLQLMGMQREMKIMELSQASNISIEQIKAELSRDAAKIQTQKELSVMAMNSKTKTPDVSAPPDEPVGKSPTGSAYQL